MYNLCTMYLYEYRYPSSMSTYRYRYRYVNVRDVLYYGVIFLRVLVYHI